MALTYVGKIDFSDMVPGLNAAAAAVLERQGEVASVLAKAEAGVDFLTKKKEAVQAELDKAQEALNSASNILNAANGVLEEASSLTSKLSDALANSGIYYYQYVGTVGSFSGELGLTTGIGLNAGLPDKHDNPGAANETIAASIIIVGGDGGIVSSLNRIGKLFGQIGGNAKSIADLYAAEEGTTVEAEIPDFPYVDEVP